MEVERHEPLLGQPSRRHCGALRWRHRRRNRAWRRKAIPVERAKGRLAWGREHREEGWALFARAWCAGKGGESGPSEKAPGVPNARGRGAFSAP